MSQDTQAEQSTSRDLGDGLVLRSATFEDREAVALLHATILVDVEETPPSERLRSFVLDLMSNRHPAFRPSDFTLVQDTATGKIVSSMCLLSQTWTYEGIPFPFGQPEIVSTDPGYRRRGFVRAQLNEVHRWSARRGELVQGITGIPWYYRQFGYEMALTLDAFRQAFRHNVPKLKEGEQETYRFRPATLEDVSFLMEMYRQTTSRSVVGLVRDEALWRYDIEGRSQKSGFNFDRRVIETLEGEPVGVVIHSRKLWHGGVDIRMFEVKPGVPFLAVTPGLLRYMDARGAEYAQRDGVEFNAITFGLGEQHPVYDTINDRLPRTAMPYAWYIRVPDLPAFVRHIVPALEKRLAASAQSGYTGELKISFYRSGLLLKFDQGRISAEAWQPTHVEDGDALFVDLTFLQSLFGYRSLEELQHAFPDCFYPAEHARALLPVLFPKKHSHAWNGG